MKIKTLLIVLFFSFFLLYLPTYSASLVDWINWTEDSGISRCDSWYKLVPPYKHRNVSRNVYTNCYKEWWRWYWEVEYLRWGYNSGYNNYCTTWKKLVILQYKLPERSRSGSAKCLFYDDVPPDLKFSFWWWYTSLSDADGDGEDDGDWKWTNKDVTLTFSASDRRDASNPWAWVGLLWVSINWSKTDITPGETITMKFTEEWVYNLVFYARDKAKLLVLDGSDIWGWNVSEKTFWIKIDKEAPGFVESDIDTNTNWRNDYPSSNFKINDVYEWNVDQIIVNRPFDCNSIKTIPLNASWNIPATSNGTISWECIKGSWVDDCTLDSQFTPNLNQCGFACNEDEGFVSSLVDNLCHPKEKDDTCIYEWINLSLYAYDKHDHLMKMGALSNTVKWTAPSIVNESSWYFKKIFNPSTWKYAPDKSECVSELSCSLWSHPGIVEAKIDDPWVYQEVETNGITACISDSNRVCCDKWILTLPNPWIPCDVDPDQIKCVKNEFCQTERNWILSSLYIKNVDKNWKIDENIWKYTSWDVEELTKTLICWINDPKPNSNWDTCDPRYYLTWVDEASYACTEVPIWEYSWQENDKFACTTISSSLEFTSNWTVADDCWFTCKHWFIDNWDRKCIPVSWKQGVFGSCSLTCWWWTQIATYSCMTDDLLPTNDSNCVWTKPVDIPSQACNTGECPTQTFTCASKPSNSDWNTVWSYTQTWNWISSWLPADTTTAYNSTWSTNECRYTCSTSYHTENSWVSCVSDTKQVSCTRGSIPTNSSYTIADVTLTWSIDSWSTATNCDFTCNPGYYLTWVDDASYACTEVPIWEYSWQENEKFACTAISNSLEFTSNWTTANDCWFTCKDWFIDKWNRECISVSWEQGSFGSCTETCWWWTQIATYSCIDSDWDLTNASNCVLPKPSDKVRSCNTQSCQRIFECEPKPDNSAWNIVSKYTQTLDSSTWIWLPVDTITAYNTAWSTKECRYKCMGWYHTEDSWVSCIQN